MSVRRGAGAHAAPGAIALRVPFRPPFDFELLLAYLAPRAIPGVECCAGGAYRRSVRLGSTPAVLTVTPDAYAWS
jgi:AraC family transcriptional regulator of adaptative response / DNA-3-methyladenine glycosylase II